MRYWQLNTESDWPTAFLIITWEPDFPHICGFHRLLMGHNYFHSTPLPDKTNEQIFLKVKKSQLWVIFVGRGVSPIIKLSCISSYGLLTPYKVSEKTNEPILRKLPQRNIVGVPQVYKRKEGELSFQIFQKGGFRFFR